MLRVRHENDLFPSLFSTPFYFLRKLHPSSSLGTVGSLSRSYLFLCIYMNPLLILLVTLTLLHALRPCSVRNSCCAYAASSAYFHHSFLLLSPPFCFFPSFSISVLRSVFSSVTKLLSSHRLSSVIQRILTNRPPFILRLFLVHHMQPDASCEAVTSFLSFLAFDDYEFNNNVLSLFLLLRALASCAHAIVSFFSIQFLLSPFGLIHILVLHFFLSCLDFFIYIYIYIFFRFNS